MIDGLEVIIRLISYLIEYVLQAETQKQLAKHILSRPCIILYQTSVDGY